MVESPPALALVLVQHKSMANDGGALGEGKDAEERREGIISEENQLFSCCEFEVFEVR